jgi:hypothetical protein
LGRFAAVRVIVPAKFFTVAMVTVYVVVLPRVTVWVAGETVSEKSAVVSTTSVAIAV